MFAEVIDVDRITPGLIRVLFAGGDLDDFEPTGFTDQYINGYFVPANATYSVPFDLDEVRGLGDDLRPRPRRFTVRRWDKDAKILTIDFVVHGDTGYAGPWAKRATRGDKLQFKGPNGSYSPNPDVDWHFFAGDETAIPSISASLETLSSNDHCVVFLVVDSMEFEMPLHSDASVDLKWLHRKNSPDPSSLLLAAIKEFNFLEGTFDVFVHGEAGEVRELRKYLLNEKLIDPETASISPYWRRNHTDEAWRKVKKEWLAEQENDF